MVERVVLVKLKDEFGTRDKRLEVASHSRGALRDLPGVRDVTVSTPADDRSGKDWDLAIHVRFDTLEEVRVYSADPAHRTYVDEYLRPKMEVIKAWNFEPI